MFLHRTIIVKQMYSRKHYLNNKEIMNKLRYKLKTRSLHLEIIDHVLGVRTEQSICLLYVY